MSFYAATKAIIENPEGEILMVQEAKEHIHETWDFPGGGWEEGESITECLKREVMEETGFTVKPGELVGIYKGASNRNDVETVVFVFTAIMEDVERKEELEEDVIRTGFHNPEEILELDLREQNRKGILKRYLEGETYPLDLLMDDLNLLRDQLN